MKSEIKKGLKEVCERQFGLDLCEIGTKEMYKTVCTYICECLAKKRKYQKYSLGNKKEIYYLSMEFLVGTSLKNNLFNMGIEEDMRLVLREFGFDIETLYELDPDAGLGNGGLGRLASCYMDSLTTTGEKATGFSIRYEFGIFKQKIIDGWQVEFPDNWLERGECWLNCREDETLEVSFGGKYHEWWENGEYKFCIEGNKTVEAVPYDMYISGYDTQNVNKLVLWSCRSPGLDMRAFSRGDYLRSMEQNTMAEVISKVLYPADNHIEGKRLRLRQQYLLVSASLQSIVSKHIKKYGNIESLPEKAAIHINDTHPSLCVPELMRILMDDYKLSWEKSWDICKETLSYTNHTVMSEALEKWSVDLFEEQLPRVYAIVKEADRRAREEYSKIYPGDTGKIEYMSVIQNGEVKMANLCLYCCKKINGVSEIHTDILEKSIFKDWYNIDNDRFCNITNGIAYRRWLCQANPCLTEYIKNKIGDKFLKNAEYLAELTVYKNDKSALDELYTVKQKNKEKLAELILNKNGITVDTSSIFDIQIKRLHEYKRQTLNVLHILSEYIKIKENPNGSYVPRTYIFGAKASAGYDLAKQIISLICSVSDMINGDKAARDYIKVVFMEDYKVSLAEKIVPACDISEQISLAGKEASGTGNMKLMINGGVTLGTLDGANGEISKSVGLDNIFLFGLSSEGVEKLKREGYHPSDYVKANIGLKNALDMLNSGIGGRRFPDIYDSIMTNRMGEADKYLVAADFSEYEKAQIKVGETYGDKYKFLRMSLMNIAMSGRFSADRAVKEYCEKVWNTI